PRRGDRHPGRRSGRSDGSRPGSHVPDSDRLTISGGEMSIAASRRQFLVHAGCGALSGAAFLTGLGRFGLIQALAQSGAPTDYKRWCACSYLAATTPTMSSSPTRAMRTTTV